MPEALELAMADLVFGPGFAPDDEAAIGNWLRTNGVGEDDARAIKEQGLERLLVYRTLVRGTLREALECAIPRTMARLGAVFDEYFDRYLAEVAPRSHYLRDVTPELLAFCQPLWPADPRVPAWSMDLARHESVQIDVASELARPLAHEPGELSLELPLRFIEAVRLMRYEYAVHRLNDDLDDRTPPAHEPTALLVYRSPEHEVRYLEQSPLAADILERLLAGQPLGNALQTACETRTIELDQKVVEGTATLLADLAERGALLGSRQMEEE
ncbi:MAG: putative DNA-binding domain-containing protein [Myxococcales bacterium]|nr:putative DNA-binding domain-containing protein [Myxococcales bacterium]